MYERTPKHREEDRDYYAEKPQDLEPLGDLRRWTLGPEYPDIRGWSLFDRDEKKIGTIDDFLVNTRNGEIIFAIASYGGALGIGAKKTLIPLDKLELESHRENAFLDVTESQLKDTPEFREDTRDFGSFYDYWSGGRVVGKKREAEEERIAAEAREKEIERERRATEERREVERRRESERREKFAKGVFAKKQDEEQVVLREGETMKIPVVGERVVGEVVVGPEGVEQREVEDHTDYMDEEEEEREEVRRRRSDR